MNYFVAKQPNGLYCRYSYAFGSVTHCNMTAEDYIRYSVNMATLRAKEDLEFSMDFTEVEKLYNQNGKSNPNIILEYLDLLDKVNMPQKEVLRHNEKTALDSKSKAAPHCE